MDIIEMLIKILFASKIVFSLTICKQKTFQCIKKQFNYVKY